MFKLGWQLILGLLLGLTCKCESTKEISELEESGIRLPGVPPSLDEFRYAPRFVSIWENRLFELNETKNIEMEPDSEYSKPKIILTPSESQMSTLLPQNAPDPLYSKKYGSLVDNFILDSLSTGTLNHEDNRLETPEGHSIQSISGKGFLFKRNLKTKQLTVNGIRVLGIRKTIGTDPVSVLEIDGFLFNHRSEISKAFNELFRKKPLINAEESVTSKKPIVTSNGTTSMTEKKETSTTTPITTTSDKSTTIALNNTEQPESTSTSDDDETDPPMLNTTMPSSDTMKTTLANVTSEVHTPTKKPSRTTSTTKTPKN